MTSHRSLEFWPDYGADLLFDGGERVPLANLPIPQDVIDRATRWLAHYEDAKVDGTRPDDAWMAEGRRLYALLRDRLADHGIELVDWEGLWALEADPPGAAD